MLALKALTLQPMHGWGSPSGSARSPATCSTSTRDRSTRRSSGCSRRGSPRLLRRQREQPPRPLLRDHTRGTRVPRGPDGRVGSVVPRRESRAPVRACSLDKTAPAWRGTTQLRTALDALVRRRREERQMDDEMRFHLEMETRWLMTEKQMSEDEARLAGKRAFGGVERYKEDVRDERGTSWIEDLRQDARFASAHSGDARVHDRGGAHARPRHRRDHHAVRRRESRAAHAAPLRSIPRASPSCGAPGRASTRPGSRTTSRRAGRRASRPSPTSGSSPTATSPSRRRDPSASASRHARERPADPRRPVRCSAASSRRRRIVRRSAGRGARPRALAAPVRRRPVGDRPRDAGQRERIGRSSG